MNRPSNNFLIPFVHEHKKPSNFKAQLYVEYRYYSGLSTNLTVLCIKVINRSFLYPEFTSSKAERPLLSGIGHLDVTANIVVAPCFGCFGNFLLGKAFHLLQAKYVGRLLLYPLIANLIRLAVIKTLECVVAYNLKILY